MRKIIFLAILVFISCKKENTPLTAQQVIDKSIAVSGSNKISKSTLSFMFRDKSYKAYRNNGAFTLSRSFKKENDSITDILSNNGFKRLINGIKVQVDSLALSYSNSVNSVHYFSVLPYGLNDKAVQKKLLKEVEIKGKDYYKIQVSFSEVGGGNDFEDVFIYWIDKQNFKVDYLAYSFRVNGGGLRFREAKNERILNGVQFVDYNNFKPINALTKLENLDKAFENNQLKKISEINLENLQLYFN